MPARSIWNGTLAIGDVAFAVKLYALVQERRVRFREVHLTDGGRIAHRRFGSDSGEEIPTERIRRAYELDDGTQVIVDDAELDAARGETRKVIDVEHFVPRAQVDPIFYERPYVLGAQSGGERPYMVLQAALARSGTLGIGRLVLRTRERLVALAPHEGVLRLYTLRFADELVGGGGSAIPSPSREPTKRELEMAARLVETMAVRWEAARHEDRHRDAVMELIRRKAAGEALAAGAAPAPAPTPDLMAALQASLATRPGRAAKTKPRARTSRSEPVTRPRGR